ncbi:hypothetical protein [Aeromonas allosaccharophila]|uniref:hypothetical protein n=1 Tax=Aeromonas allosaccharophila TaxID=656 RepID=UPI002AE0A91F|nr:hypothetical protein [Aeromonas allosaccharophila]
MLDHILFIFEGKRTEHVIADSLLRFFIENENKVVVKSSYGTNIYDLYKNIKDDEFIDIFALIRERDNSLTSYSRDQFSQIYLFFDYDGHAPAASNDKLAEMLSFFNEETENGKLFVSYPMVESTRYIADLTFESILVRDVIKLSDLTRFKEIVHNEAAPKYQNVANYSKRDWQFLVNLHCKKANLIIGNGFVFPKSNVISQEDILTNQNKNHIIPNNEVSILSAFPLMILDYYGVNSTRDKIYEKQINNT